MGFAEEVEKRLSRVRILLQDESNDAEAQTGTSDEPNLQEEIDKTESKIQQLSIRLKADEELIEQKKSDVAEKRNEIERLTAELQAVNDGVARGKQNLADLEFRKARASAEISPKDAETQEEYVNTIFAYEQMTGVSFNTARQGFVANRETRKAKFFEVPHGVPMTEAADNIWNTIKSTIT